jgi:predicted RNA polymerase sigma factor
VACLLRRPKRAERSALNRIEFWLQYRAELFGKADRLTEAVMAYNRAIEAEENLRKGRPFS